MAENGKTQKYRNSCMALFEAPKFDMSKILYACYQPELCPTTGKLHYQTYVEFKDSYPLKSCQKYVGVDNCHIERRRGDPEEARNYCFKSESKNGDFVELGDFNTCPKLKNKGKRTDLKKLAEDVINGKKMDEIDPVMIIKYSKGIKELKAIQSKKINNRYVEPTVCVIWGDAGVGKTKSIYDKEGFENCYKLDKTNNEVWFDGYQGEKILIIDDFYGWIQWGQLLNILDGYPLKLQIKGGHDWKAWEKVYITSNKHYSEWYSREDISALTRRIKYEMHMLREEGKEIRKPVKINSLADF